VAIELVRAVGRFADEHDARLADPVEQRVVIRRAAGERLRPLPDDIDDLPVRRRMRIVSRCDPAGRREDRFHFLVGCLVEVPVPLTDRHELWRDERAHDFVRQPAEPRARFLRADGRRHDDARRLVVAQRHDRRLHRRARREAVVDEDHGAAGERGARSSATIERVTAIEFEPLASGHLVDRGPRDAEVGHDLAADDHDAAFGDRAHGQFGMARHAELADETDVERRRETRRHFGRDGHAAARQRQHDDIGSTGVLGQEAGQAASGIRSVLEALHDALLDQSRGDGPCAVPATPLPGVKT
jgi:hypothetical protein